MYDIRVILVCSSLESKASFLGLSVAMLLDCLHTLGILFLVKHMFSIQCNHIVCALGPRYLSCSTSTSSMFVVLLFLSVVIFFLYSSSVEWINK